MFLGGIAKRKQLNGISLHPAGSMKEHTKGGNDCYNDELRQGAVLNHTAQCCLDTNGLSQGAVPADK